MHIFNFFNQIYPPTHSFPIPSLSPFLYQLHVCLFVFNKYTESASCCLHVYGVETSMGHGQPLRGSIPKENQFSLPQQLFIANNFSSLGTL